MHQPPTNRFPSYTELYGPGFGVMVACAVLDVVLAAVLLVVKGLFAVTDSIAWFTGDQGWRTWAETTGSLANTVGTVCLVSFPILLTAVLILFVFLDFVEPKALPPWTTRERLRTARALAGDAVMGDDPQVNFLARVYAGAATRMRVPLTYQHVLTISLIGCGFLALSGVYVLVQSMRDGDPSLMAFGLHSIILGSGMAAANLVLLPQRRRMRAFCDLYDASHQRAAL
ncbi:hypothetical protein [Nocardiopsis halotolerans]|uniref:hypothetical protein n=1 Tax=Nocardiopsis halotolerans TaxID=124252 RepID=UPI00034907F4|nr:hypothetical protein [Nocardiopsis halotolerans]